VKFPFRIKRHSTIHVHKNSVPIREYKKTEVLTLRAIDVENSELRTTSFLKMKELRTKITMHFWEVPWQAYW